MAAHGNAILGYCARMVHDEATANDMLQQTFVQAYRDLDRFEGRASVRTWLISIAHNRCLDALKHDQRLRQRIESDEQVMLEYVDPAATPGERLDRARLLKMLDHCVRLLPHSMRATLLERYVTGCTYDELEQLLGASANTLQARVARALRRLKECLEKHGWSHD